MQQPPEKKAAAAGATKRKLPKEFDAAEPSVVTFPENQRNSLEVVKTLSLLEQRVVKFVSNAQKTVEALATLPAATDDEDSTSRLEDLVDEQMDILARLQAELPPNVAVLGNYRASNTDCYDKELANQDFRKRLRILRDTMDSAGDASEGVGAASAASK